MKSDAKLSKCRTYRYALWRTWDESKPFAMFIGLNPSTADEQEDDPIISRCINFSKLLGYGGLCMVNLFAYRATDPSALFLAQDPIGPENDRWLHELSESAGIIIGAWGNTGAYLNRSSDIRKMFNNIHSLKLNKTGEPAHPLYQPSTATPILVRI